MAACWTAWIRYASPRRFTFTCCAIFSRPENCKRTYGRVGSPVSVSPASMKTLFALIILIAVGYVGFQYAYPPIVDMLGLQKTVKQEEVEIPQPVIVNVDPAPAPPKPAAEEAKPEMPKTPEPAPPASMPSPTPAPAVASGMGASVPVADADGFVPPTFPPIEDVVKNWME